MVGDAEPAGGEVLTRGGGIYVLHNNEIGVELKKERKGHTGKHSQYNN